MNARQSLGCHRPYRLFRCQRHQAAIGQAYRCRCDRYRHRPAMTFGGKIAFSRDGQPVDFSKHYFYRNCMFSNMPNLAGIFGYVNASWTLAGRYRRPVSDPADQADGRLWRGRRDPGDASRRRAGRRRRARFLLRLYPARQGQDAEERRRPCRGGSTRITCATAPTCVRPRSTTEFWNSLALESWWRADRAKAARGLSRAALFP